VGGVGVLGLLGLHALGRAALVPRDPGVFSAAIQEELTGRENLEIIGRLYHLSWPQARSRAVELLEQFGLSDAADRAAKTYSGGMQRRLDLAASLVGRPKVLFLDEPTTGLDPRSRLGMWDIIRSLVADGTTLLLTTQYLDEADELADEIVVIDHGEGHAVEEEEPAGRRRGRRGSRSGSGRGSGPGSGPESGSGDGPGDGPGDGQGKDMERTAS
jgi:ABC-type multidrug transport system ATPase subunit